MTEKAVMPEDLNRASMFVLSFAGMTAFILLFTCKKVSHFFKNKLRLLPKISFCFYLGKLRLILLKSWWNSSLYKWRDSMFEEYDSFSYIAGVYIMQAACAAFFRQMPLWLS
jgi:hypothetical protein